MTVQPQITSYAGYVPKILSQKASNTLPDVLGVENSLFASFAANGVLDDLTGRLRKDPSFKQSDFSPKITDRFTYHGHIYGIPYDVQPVAGFFYNKSLFDKAHVAYPAPNWTWADMLATAKKLTVRNGGRVVQYGLEPGDGGWRTFVYAHGGRIADDYRNPKKIVLDSPQALAGLAEYVGLYQKPNQVAPLPNLLVVGTTASGLSQADLFTAGKVAMYIAGYWEFVFAPQKFSPLKLGYAMIPAGPHGDRGYTTGGTCYSVAAGSKRADRAYKFIKYYMGMPGWRAAYQSAPLHAIYPPLTCPPTTAACSSTIHTRRWRTPGSTARALSGPFHNRL